MSASNHTAINNSVSKHLYSFSKSQRFPTKRSLNNKVAYEVTSEFQKVGSGGAGRPFFHTTTRFSYYGSPGKYKPSPFHYNLGHTFGTESRKTNEQYSFGVGRDNMKKVFIEDIKKHGDGNRPGPGRYSHEKPFASVDLKYTMGSKLYMGEKSLDKSKKLPGPGFYQHPEVTGMAMTQSHIKTESKFSFGKAQDRFNVPTRKIPAPAPDVYSPLNNLNENYNSTFIQAQQTKIGKNSKSIIDQHFKLNTQKENPGPG